MPILKEINFSRPLNYIRALAIPFRIDPLAALVNFAHHFVQMAIAPLTVLITAYFIDTALAVLNEGLSSGAINHSLHFLDMDAQGERENAGAFAADAEEIISDAAAVTANGVSFSYPGAERPAVDNVTLHIAANETVAIVGANGSGKTTLVKLLCGAEGLYAHMWRMQAGGY